MSLSAGNSIYKVPFNLLCSRFSGIRLKRCGAVKCLKDKEYSTGLPVRYIPKKLREAEKLEITPGKNDRKDLRFDNLNSLSKKSNDRQENDVVHENPDKKLDNWSDLAKDPAGDFGLVVGSLDFELTPDSLGVAKEIQVSDVNVEDKNSEVLSSKRKKDAEKIIVELLASRPFTAMELRKILSAKSFPCNIVEEVIYDLSHRLKNGDHAMSSKDGPNFSSSTTRCFPKKSQDIDQLHNFVANNSSEDLNTTQPTRYQKLPLRAGYAKEGFRQNLHSQRKMLSPSRIDPDQGITNKSVESIGQALPLEELQRKVSAKRESTEVSHCTTGLLELELMDNDDELDEELLTINNRKEAEQQELEFSQTNHDAEKCAVELLASRAFTTMELRKKLKAKGFALSVVDRVVRDFRSKGLINDYLYAETFSRSRWTSSTWGPGRINQALKRKGVNQADAKKAIESVFGEDGADGEESSCDLSTSSMDQLFVQASKKWLLSRNLPRETRKARIIRWLQYRGFDWGVVSMIVKKLESQHTP
ncbi:Regulatory protein RecX-like protein [Drosera capensis]